MKAGPTFLNSQEGGRTNAGESALRQRWRLRPSGILLPILLFLAIQLAGVASVSASSEEEPAAAKNQRLAVHDQQDLLSPNERQWLSRQAHIRIGITVIPPQILLIDGGYQGLSIDYIRLLEKKLDFRFELVPYPTWNDVMEAAKSREVDMIFAAQMTPERLSYLQFSEPYIELPNMILVRKDRSGGEALKAMTGWTVAVSERSAVHEHLTTAYPGLNLVPVRDELTGLMKVSMGEVDAMVVEISRASYYIDKAGIVNLRASGNAEYLYQLRFAIRNDWPILSGILNKGLASVTAAERESINRRWILLGETNIFANRLFWAACGAIMLIIVAVSAWNMTLHRLVKSRTKQLLQELAERKHAEAQLTEYRDKLEETVERRTKELLMARDAALAANKAKSVFLANMSHELRTPLNAILGFSNMMRRDPDVSDRQRENLDIINHSGEHLLNLINDVLEVAKIESGRQHVEIAAFDLESMVDDVVRMMRVKAQEKNLDIVLERCSELPRHVKSDEAKLRQILINLINNAVKFTHQGGVTVRLQTKESAGHRLLIDVADTGQGIVTEDRQRIFEPFVQLTDSGVQSGTGLGLTITRQFVRMLGGNIAVDSLPGKGSVFRVEVPMEPASEDEFVFPASKPYRQVMGLAPGQPAYRILIVEDQLENRLLLSRLMTDLGLETKTAENGEQSLKIFQEWQPDLIWMDRRMPVMDGKEAAQRIRQLAGGDRVKIVAVTASVFKEEQQEMLEAGTDDFVRKPYRFDEIYECLARQLNLEFVYRREPTEEAEPAGEAILAKLANMPPELCKQLKEALQSLDSERIGAIIHLISAQNAELGGALFELAENFNYPVILKYLGPGQSAPHGAES